MIILTGGAGFIGSCFLAKLNSCGINDVVVVDEKLSGSKWRNLLGKSFQDYIPKDKFMKLLGSNRLTTPDHIIHIGACSSTLVTDWEYLSSNNYEYSKKLAIWAFKYNVPFIYASSAATYGDGSFGYNDSDENTLRLKPLNLYALSKQLFDLWVIENKYVDKVTGLKFFNVFGPNEYHKEEMRSIICKNFPEIVKGNPVRLFKSYNQDYKDGEQKRDFIYIKDVMDVIYYFFKHPKKTGIFNLGTGVARSWNDLVRAMFMALEKVPSIEYIDMPNEIREKYQYFTQANMEKLKQAGYKASFYTLEEAISDYMGYLKNRAYL